MPPAIRIEELTKDYAIGFWRRRPYRALDRLSLDIEQGEIFGFLGPNGAGKTTTLKLLMQLIFPTSGRAEILGRPVGDLATRQRIGYLPENPYFYDYLTAEELLHYFAQLFGYNAAERRTRVPTLLDRVGLGAERRMQLGRGIEICVGAAQPRATRVVPARPVQRLVHERGEGDAALRADALADARLGRSVAGGVCQESGRPVGRGTPRLMARRLRSTGTGR